MLIKKLSKLKCEMIKEFDELDEKEFKRYKKQIFNFFKIDRKSSLQYFKYLNLDEKTLFIRYMLSNNKKYDSYFELYIAECIKSLNVNSYFEIQLLFIGNERLLTENIVNDIFTKQSAKNRGVFKSFINIFDKNKKSA